MTKLLLIVGLVAACGGTSKPGSQVTASPIILEWRAAAAENGHVTVTLVVAGAAVELGLLNAVSDSQKPSPAACDTVDTHEPTLAEFQCGGTPAYNAYAAELKGGELVVTLHTYVSTDSDSVEDEQHKVVKRIPVSGSSLAVVAYKKG